MCSDEILFQPYNTTPTKKTKNLAFRGEHARAKETPHKKIGVNGIMIYWGAVAVAPVTVTDGDLAPPDSRLSTPEARRGRA